MSNENLYEEYQAKCRALESEPDLKTFIYQARVLWWEYQEAAKVVVTFREFWGNEATYPRTIETV